MHPRVDEAITILRALGLPKPQHNERSALTLLALLDLTPEKPWAEATAPLCGITPMMEFFALHYAKQYAPNTRETVRRQTVHQFQQAGLVVGNPDDIYRAVNSGKSVYQIEPTALELLRTFGNDEWDAALSTYLASVRTLQQQHAHERDMARIPVRVGEGTELKLSPGGQNVLIERVLHEFAPRFTPGGSVLYVGDADEKWAHFQSEDLKRLGVTIETHGKMPDVVIYRPDKNTLYLIEAVTSHGPVDTKRQNELAALFRGTTARLIMVTAFLTHTARKRFDDVAWETHIWVADTPDHMIHHNGDKFLDL